MMARSNDNGADARNADPAKTFDNQHLNYPTQDDNSKALATLRARAALCGCTLHELSDGYLIGRWSLCRTVPDLRAVGDLLRQIGGPR